MNPLTFTPQLVLDQLTFRRGPRTVIDRVSMSLPFGEHLALVGPNGSGKTSLLQLLIGRLQAEVARAGADGAGAAREQWVVGGDEIVRPGRGQGNAKALHQRQQALFGA